MIISIIADTHLNKMVYKGIPDRIITDLPFRSVDFMRAFEYIVDQNINSIKPDLIVIVGDVYDSFDPSNLVREFFNNQLRKLSEAKIPIIVLIGQHDVCRKHHALKPVAALGLKNVKVIESPKMISFKDKILMLFPFSMEIEKGIITVKEQFYSFLKDSKKKISDNPDFQNKDILFFGHFGVKGATLNRYTEYLSDDTILSSENDPVVLEWSRKKNVINNNDKDISLKDLDSIGAEYVFLGDYHQHQVLGTEKCIAMYAGSIEKNDISEIDQKKGYIIYDSNAEEGLLGKCKYVEYPNCRPMVELKGNLRQIEEEFEKIGIEKRGAIVRIIFEGSSDELTTFSIGLEGLKRKMRSKIDPIYVYHLQNVINKEEEKAANIIEKEIMEKGHISKDDVIDVVNSMIRESSKDNEEIEILIEMAKDIYSESKMEK